MFKSATEIKVLFPESGWKLKMWKRGSRVEIALYWANKETPTHVTAIDLDDLIKFIGEE